MEPSLVKWVNTFERYLPQPIISLSDLADGTALADILAAIVPSSFENMGIKREVGNNYHLKVTNIKKIISKLNVYWVREGSEAIVEDLEKLDIHSIGKNGNVTEITKLLEIVLLVAVACENKQTFIAAIMKLDREVQAQLMVCIEKLMQRRSSKRVSPRSVSSPSLGAVFASASAPADAAADSQQKLLSSLEDTKAKLEEVQLDYSNVLAENANLLSEKEKHLAMIKALEHALAEREKESEREREAAAAAVASAASPSLAGRVISASEREKELSEANLALHHELDAKTAALADARRRLDTELPRVQRENRDLRDELDILKEKVADAEKHRRAAAKLQIKAEELADLRRQLKAAEDTADGYLRKTLALEEDSKKVSSLRNQLEAYKEQLAAAVAARSEAESLAASRGLEIAKLRDTVLALETDTAGLRRQLEAHEEWGSRGGTAGNGTTGHANGSSWDAFDDSSTAGSPMPKALSTAILTPEIKEQVLRLERENQRLRTASEKMEELENQLDDAKRLIARYQEDKLTATSRIERLSEQVAQLQASGGGSGGATASPRQSSEKLLEVQAQLITATERLRAAEEKLSSDKARIEQLEAEHRSLLADATSPKNNHEVDSLKAELRARSEKIEALNGDKTKLETYLRTAKSMIKKMKEQQASGALSAEELERVKKQQQEDIAKFKLQYEAQLQSQRQQLQERDEMLAMSKRAWDESKESSQRELQLVVSAFYGMGLELQRLKAPQLGIPGMAPPGAAGPAGGTATPPGSPARDLGGSTSPRGPVGSSFLSNLRRAV